MADSAYCSLSANQWRRSLLRVDTSEVLVWSELPESAVVVGVLIRRYAVMAILISDQAKNGEGACLPI